MSKRNNTNSRMKSMETRITKLQCIVSRIQVEIWDPVCHMYPLLHTTYTIPITYGLRSTAYDLIPTTYYLRPATHDLSPTTYLLPTAYYLLPTTYYLPAATHYLLHTTYYRPPTIDLVLPVTTYLSYRTDYPVPTAYYILPTYQPTTYYLLRILLLLLRLPQLLPNIEYLIPTTQHDYDYIVYVRGVGGRWWSRLDSCIHSIPITSPKVYRSLGEPPTPPPSPPPPPSTTKHTLHTKQKA